MLNEPKMSFNLSLGGASGSSSESQIINAHCMDFPEDETDKLYIGAEDYNIYQANIHSQSGSHVD